HMCLRHLQITPCHLCWVGSEVTLIVDSEPPFGGGLTDQFDHHFMTCKWAPAPVHADVREEAVLDLVPLARTWRQVADRDVQTGLGGQAAQFVFPQPHSVAVATAAVGTDQ